MGLDWMLQKAKPQEGQELLYARINEQWQTCEEPGKKAALKAAALDVAITAYEVIKCPKVGEDPKADEWFTGIYKEANGRAQIGTPDKRFNTFWLQPLEACRTEHKGMPVFDLAEDKRGFSQLQGIMTSPLDMRGKIIAYHLRNSGFEDLSEAAFEDHTAEEAVLYARALKAVLESGALPGDIEKDHAEYAEHCERVRSDMQAAIDWLSFWGEHGFGFNAWF